MGLYQIHSLRMLDAFKTNRGRPGPSACLFSAGPGAGLLEVWKKLVFHAGTIKSGGPTFVLKALASFVLSALALEPRKSVLRLFNQRLPPSVFSAE